MSFFWMGDPRDLMKPPKETDKELETPETTETPEPKEPVINSRDCVYVAVPYLSPTWRDIEPFSAPTLGELEARIQRVCDVSPVCFRIEGAHTACPKVWQINATGSIVSGVPSGKGRDDVLHAAGLLNQTMSTVSLKKPEVCSVPLDASPNSHEVMT